MKNDNEITDWMTVKGNHIPIRKGQTREAAMLAFLSETEDNEPFKDRTQDIKKGKALSQKEFAVWYKKIGEVKRGGYVHKSKSGEKYIPIEEKDEYGEMKHHMFSEILHSNLKNSNL